MKTTDQILFITVLSVNYGNADEAVKNSLFVEVKERNKPSADQ